MNPYEFSDDARKEYDKAGSFVLERPRLVKNFTRKVDGEPQAFVEWPEYLQISDIEWVEPGLKEPAQPDDITFALNFQFKVCPESQQHGEKTKNAGAMVFNRLCFNIPALTRNAKSGQGVMTSISAANLKAFLKAFGIDPAEGASPKAFYEKYRDSLRGQKIWANISAGPDKNGQERNNIEKFFKATP